MYNGVLVSGDQVQNDSVFFFLKKIIFQYVISKFWV